MLLFMELYKPISDSGGAPLLALPLGFVVFVSLMKDIYEDVLRHRQDKDENNRKVQVVSKKKVGKGKDKKEVPEFKTKAWKQI